MVNIYFARLPTSTYKNFQVIATILVLSASNVGAGHRAHHRTPSPSGELIGDNPVWRAEISNPCYMPQSQFDIQQQLQQQQQQQLTDSGSSSSSLVKRDVETVASVTEDGVRYSINVRSKRDISQQQQNNNTTNFTQHHHTQQSNSSANHTELQRDSQPSGIDLNEVFYAITRAGIIRSVLEVGNSLETILALSGGDQCLGLDLQTLPDFSPVIHPNTAFTTAALNFYRYLGYVRAHVLVMLEDWKQYSVYSCGTLRNKALLTTEIRGLDWNLKSLLCSMKIDLEKLGTPTQYFEDLAQPIVNNTRIYRYPSCLPRKMRDCLLMNKIHAAFYQAVTTLPHTL